jgi:predicted nuclease of predicted toxin-antitoxin system
MNLKLDENLPNRLAVELRNLGHDVHTLKQEQLVGRSDTEVWTATQEESRFLIPQDLDFSDLRSFAPGTHRGILLLRLRSPGRLALIQRITSLFRSESVEEWADCFVVATERKIRVMRPDK